MSQFDYISEEDTDREDEHIIINNNININNNNNYDINNLDDINLHLSRILRERKEMYTKLRELSQFEAKCRDRSKILANLSSNNLASPITYKERMKNSRISPEVRHLILHNVENGMKRSDIVQSFQISQGSICNILKEKRKKEDEGDLPPPKKKKTGPMSPFDSDTNIVHLLTWVEEAPGLTLNELVVKFAQINVPTSKSNRSLFKKGKNYMEKISSYSRFME